MMNRPKNLTRLMALFDPEGYSALERSHRDWFCNSFRPPKVCRDAGKKTYIEHEAGWFEFSANTSAGSVIDENGDTWSSQGPCHMIPPGECLIFGNVVTGYDPITIQRTRRAITNKPSRWWEFWK